VGNRLSSSHYDRRRVNGAVGFRAKTGRAIAVVLDDSFSLVWRGEVKLSGDPESGPYHHVMELPWAEAQVAVREYVKPIEQLAIAALREVIARVPVSIRAAGVAGSPPRNIDRIGNPHIRAHAAEGILFRRVLEQAAEALGIPCTGYSDRGLDTAVARPLARVAGPPWRADERLAATAAWLAISNATRSGH